ncbi:MAG TPA: YceD family protein [Lamprocystis sp. (in: g-proteobacteria)]|nr:YceD family protein [Lamprocystis sp. (in: g-proteobacteria)]
MSALPRLQAAVNGAAGAVRYVLGFERDAQGQAVAMGHAAMQVRLTCQRCLGEVDVPLDVPIALALVRAAAQRDRLGLTQITGLPDHLDPMPLGDEPVRPLDWVEDELLLAIPQVPMHPPGDCEAADAANRGEPALAHPANPFAVLAALRGGSSGTVADKS